MVEYIENHINSLSWQLASKSSDITAPDCCGENVISGSNSSVAVWQFKGTQGAYDQLPITEVASESTKDAACRVHLIGNIAFSALVNGSVLLHELVTDRNERKFLNLISETENLHSRYRCNDMLFCAQTNSVITCGNDGAISTFNIEHPQKFNRNKVSESSLKCMDIVNPNEIICGTLNGSLIHIDLRTYEHIGSFANQTLSTLLCVQRNPNVNHYAIGGNDEGSIMIYDLRNDNCAVAKISAHSAAITCVRYRPKDSNTLYSSSCDGELFKWNLNTEFTANQVPRKIESVSCINDPLSILSFDVNNDGDMIYTTDHGAVFYHKFNEIGP